MALFDLADERHLDAALESGAKRLYEYFSHNDPEKSYPNWHSLASEHKLFWLGAANSVAGR
jgi:hypothetical protein